MRPREQAKLPRGVKNVGLILETLTILAFCAWIMMLLPTYTRPEVFLWWFGLAWAMTVCLIFLMGAFYLVCRKLYGFYKLSKQEQEEEDAREMAAAYDQRMMEIWGEGGSAYRKDS